MTAKVLLILHQRHSTPGRIGRVLQEMGFEIELCMRALGAPLPQSLTDYAGAVIFGGPMSANDDDKIDFIREELEWLDVPLAEKKPFLGVCLGAQLLTRALGGRVAPHPDGWNEIGYYPVYATSAGATLFAEEQFFYQWHSEAMWLPASTQTLAVSDLFEVQAFCYGNDAFGIQFHPEVTREMMQLWTRKAAHRMVLPGAQARENHLDGQRCHDGAVDGWIRQFLADWLARRINIAPAGSSQLRAR